MVNKNGERDQNTKTGEKELKKKTRTLNDPYRVNVSEEVHELLRELVQRSNDGFDGGEVTRSDVANFLLLKSGKSFIEADIKSLRNLHFDERKMLSALLHQSAKNGELPEEIKLALRTLSGFTEQTKKRSTKLAKDLSTADSVDNSAA